MPPKQGKGKNNTLENTFKNGGNDGQKQNFLTDANNLKKALQHLLESKNDDNIHINIIKYIKKIYDEYEKFLSDTTNDTKISKYYNFDNNEYKYKYNLQILKNIIKDDEFVKLKNSKKSTIFDFFEKETIENIEKKLISIFAIETNVMYNNKDLFEHVKKCEYYLTNGMNNKYEKTGGGTQGAIDDFINANNINAGEYYNPTPEHIEIVYDSSGADSLSSNPFTTVAMNNMVTIKTKQYANGSVFLQTFEPPLTKMKGGNTIIQNNVIAGVYDIYGVNFRDVSEFKDLLNDKDNESEYVKFVKKYYSKLFDNFFKLPFRVGNDHKLYVLVVREIPGNNYAEGLTPDQRMLTKKGIRQAFETYKNQLAHGRRIIFGGGLKGIMEENKTPEKQNTPENKTQSEQEAKDTLNKQKTLNEQKAQEEKETQEAKKSQEAFVSKATANAAEQTQKATLDKYEKNSNNYAKEEEKTNNLIQTSVKQMQIKDGMSFLEGVASGDDIKTIINSVQFDENLRNDFKTKKTQWGKNTFEIKQDYDRKTDEIKDMSNTKYTTIYTEKQTEVNNILAENKRRYEDEVKTLEKDVDNIQNDRDLGKLVNLQRKLYDKSGEYKTKVYFEQMQLYNKVFKKDKTDIQIENIGVQFLQNYFKNEKNEFENEYETEKNETNSLRYKFEEIQLKISSNIRQLLEISNEFDTKKSQDDESKMIELQKELQKIKTDITTTSANVENEVNVNNSAFNHEIRLDDSFFTMMKKKLGELPNSINDSSVDNVSKVQVGGVKYRKFFSDVKDRVDRLIFYVYYYEDLVLSMITLNKQIEKEIKNSKKIFDNSKKDFSEYKKMYDNFHNYFKDLHDLLKNGKSDMIEKIQIRYEKISDFNDKYENRIRIKSIKDVIKKLRKINIQKLKEDIEFTDV
jgi:hypothetical protein